MRYKKPLVLMLIWALMMALAAPVAAADPVVLVDGVAYGFHSLWTVELTDAATGMVHEVGQTIGLHDRSRERRVTNFVPFDEAKAWVESLHGSWQFVQDHGAWVTIEAGGLSGQYIRLRDLVKYSGGNVDAYDSINTRVTVTATQPPGAQIDLSNLIVTLDKGCSWRLFIDDKLVASGVCESELDLGKYLPPGEHDVRLEIIDDKGRTTVVEETLTGLNKKPVYRNLQPVAAITMPGTVYRGEQLEIRSGSYDPDGEIVEQTWNVEPAAAMNGTLLDDGGIVSFEEVGVYKITLTVKDNAGATASTTKTLEVLKNVPVASFTMADEASPLVPVTVIHTSKDIDNLITDVAWAIEPAAAVTAQLGDNGGHITFNQPGSYVVTLTITDSDGDIHTCERSIEIINLPPVAIIEAPDQVIQGEDLEIKSLSFDPDTPIVSLNWTVEPTAAVIGQLAGEQSTIYFDEPGTYTVRLTVTDLFGEIDTTTATIEVAQAVPVAAFVVTDGDYKQHRTLTLDASDSRGSARYPVDFSQTQWEFVPPESVPLTAAEVVQLSEEVQQVAFKAAGDWKVRVSVANTKGTRSPWYEQTLSIDPHIAPVAVISLPTQAVQGEDVEVESLSYGVDADIVDYVWSVSPAADVIGQLAGEQSTIYFDEPGNYVVTLTVVDLYGATDISTATIDVVPAVPTAAFEIAEGTLKENRRLVLDASQSQGSNRYPVDFSQTQWEFVPPVGVDADAVKMVAGGPQGAPEITFKAAGDWTVRVSVANTKGTRSDWIESTLTINPDLPPIAGFSVVTDLVTRDPANQNKAAIELVDQSTSPDGDLIGRRIWKYRYDSQNKGNFDGEPWVVFDDGNEAQVTFKAGDVGRYEFALEVEEAPGQEIIPTFWDDLTDARKAVVSGQTAEVVNEAPEAQITLGGLPRLDQDPSVAVVVVGEEVKLPTAYTDPNNDPKYAERWQYQHDETYFDNNQGRVDFHDAPLSDPVTVFDKVGLYRVLYQVQDSPKDDDRFADYRLWSKPSEVEILVHRRPVAEFSYTLVEDPALYPKLDAVVHGVFGAQGKGSSFTSAATNTMQKLGTHGWNHDHTTKVDEPTTQIRMETRESRVSGTVWLDRDGGSVDMGSVINPANYKSVTLWARAKLPNLSGFHHPRFVVSSTGGGGSWLTVWNAYDQWSNPTNFYARATSPFRYFQATAFDDSHEILDIWVTLSRDVPVPYEAPPELNDSLLLADLTARTWRDSSDRYVVLVSDVVPVFNDINNVINQYNAQGVKVLFVGTAATKAFGERLANGTGGAFIQWDGITIPWSAIEQYLANQVPSYPLKPVFTSASYDPDRQAQADRGIVEEKWNWRVSGASAWNNGIPSAINPGAQYEVSLQVKDQEGAWSLETVKTVSQGVTSTAARTLFTVGQNPLPKGNAFTYSDLSYDPAGIVEKRWRVRTPAGEWLDFGGSPPNFSGLPLGDYLVELRVRNGLGEWSEPATQTVTVGP